MKKLLKVNIRNKKFRSGTTLSTCVWKFKENNTPGERESVTEKLHIWNVWHPKAMATAVNILTNTEHEERNKKKQRLPSMKKLSM